jgi:para-nitrobenzyl esterase
MSRQVPLMIGWCESEQRLTFAAEPAIYRQSEHEAVTSIARMLGVAQVDAAALMQAYRSGRPGDSPGDLYAQIYGDQRYRRSVTEAADRHARGGAPTWMYMLDWKTPVLDGLLRTPHTLCLAFVFGNVAAATGITGEGAERFDLQERMTGAWVAFARAGRPDHPGLPPWPTYSADNRETMVFGRDTRIERDPLAEERRAIESYPRYLPAIGEGMLR